MDFRKLEGLAGVENCGMLGKVPVVRIIETVLVLSDPIDDKQKNVMTFNELSCEHFNSPRALSPVLEVVRSHSRIFF